jgi:hypothetical protein
MGRLDGTGSLLTPASNHPVERTAHSAGFWGSSWLSACGPPLTGSVDMICIATACAKRTSKTRLLAQALSKSSDFLICLQGKS